jgi:hypothetical protein
VDAGRPVELDEAARAAARLRRCVGPLDAEERAPGAHEAPRLERGRLSRNEWRAVQDAPVPRPGVGDRRRPVGVHHQNDVPCRERGIVERHASFATDHVGARPERNHEPGVRPTADDEREQRGAPLRVLRSELELVPPTQRELGDRHVLPHPLAVQHGWSRDAKLVRDRSHELAGREIRRRLDAHIAPLVADDRDESQLDERGDVRRRHRVCRSRLGHA